MGCNKIIKSIDFLDHEQYLKKVFHHRLRKYRCRFCAEIYQWEALGRHERICYVDASEKVNDNVLNYAKLKDNYLSKTQFLDKMQEIITQVFKTDAHRLEEYERETIEMKKSASAKTGSDFDINSIKGFLDHLKQMRSAEQQKDNVDKFMEVLRSYPHTLEPPSQEEMQFVMFKAFDKSFKVFKFIKDKVDAQTITLSKKGDSRSVVKTKGFQVIQTPVTNRIFLVGGEENPWGTFEFDIKARRFYPIDHTRPDKGSKNPNPINVPLAIGRVNHSLVATPGLIFCTGGQIEHLRRNDESEYDNDDGNGRIIEVFKLKENMWIEYSNRLMNARFAHSSVIMGNYLYLLHGYDAVDSVLNCVSIERIKIDIDDAKCHQDPKYNSTYVINDDIAPRFTRCFNSIYTAEPANKIIYFGYGGLEGKCKSPYEQNSDFRKNDEKTQKYQKYILRDEYPRYNTNAYPQRSEQLEYKTTQEEIKVWVPS